MTRSADIIEFVHRYLCVPEGLDVGKPLRLRQWQQDILRGIYDADEAVRRAIISMGRKNSKSATTAMLLLAHLCGPESKRNSQIFSTATSRDQAAIVYGLASRMVRMNATLNGMVRCTDSRKEMFCPATGVRYRALSQDAGVAHGLSPALHIADELGRVTGPRSPLFEALETGAAAQESPLTIVISTQAPADSDLLSILIDDALKEGPGSRTKLFLFAAPPEADPWSEETWRLANPALGDFQSLAEVAELAAIARRMPAQESSFRNLVLNQRVNAEIGHFLSPEVWQANGEPADLSVLETSPVWVGLDLAVVNDLCAVVLAAERDGVWHLKPCYFIPEIGLAERARHDRVPFDLWVRDGYAIPVLGKVVNMDFVAQFLLPVLRDLDVRAIACDRFFRPVLAQAFLRLGYEPPFEDFGGPRTMAPAVTVIETLLLEGRVRHGNHPLLTWNALNARVLTDDLGNRRFTKTKSTGRIDGLVAMANALGAATLAEPPEPDPYYATRDEHGELRGLLVLRV
jgi:phage terminase large subunit-like protein